MLGFATRDNVCFSSEFCLPKGSYQEGFIIYKSTGGLWVSRFLSRAFFVQASVLGQIIEILMNKKRRKKNKGNLILARMRMRMQMILR